MPFFRHLVLSLVTVAALIAIPAAANDDLIVLEGRAPFTPTAADEALNQRIIDVLSSDEKIRGVISITSHQGNVHLDGNLKGVAMIYRCVKLLKEMDGVKSVNVDNLEG